MKRKMKRVLGILLSVVLLLGMLPEMAIPVLAYDNNPYAALAGTTTTVKFNNMDWYVIEDSSTAVNSGTVTLLLKNPEETTEFKDRKAFNENYNNAYSSSPIKQFLDGLTTEGGSFAAVASAIADTSLPDVNVTNAKLYLLSKTETEAITNNDVRKPPSTWSWWSRTPAGSYNNAVYEVEYDGKLRNQNVANKMLVRPALRLDLSKVIYRAGTFMPASNGYNISITGGTNTVISGGDTSQTDLTGEMTTVTYTAEEGYHFPLFTDITDNGITATRVNKTTVTVSGTPTYDVSIIIPDAVMGYSVSLTGGANADRYGFATQTGISDSMTTVSYSAHAGYLFEPFEEIAQNGVTVTRIDKTSVIVSGTPDDDVVITVPDAREGYTVTITAGANTTPDNNENTTQTNLTEEMETVTYSADEGYHFALFPDITRDGITVTRTNDKKVTVSGTPTDDVSITVPDAEAVTEDSYSAFHITGEDSEEELAGKRISFGGHEWYVIKDDSTGENTGTLTLLSAYFMGKSAFNKSGRGIDYSDSDIRNAVNSLLEDDGNLKAVSGAMDPVTVISYKYDSTSEVQNTIDNQKLWLLSVSEAENLPRKIRACALAPGKPNEDWWLRSPGRENIHACFMSALANVNDYGYISTVYGIRPALKLKLSKVVFDSGSKTFRLPGSHSVTISGGEGAATSGGSAYQSDVTGEMNTVTYTAKKEYHFEEFATVSENGVTVSRIDSKTVMVS
ncbi:MAG: DUF6273 domain-containing protein, partial [Lachnospiraceae bacterium]|nr:DUF6273 domain-containing protein [Lachnospiraceae bacterium]